MARLAPHTGRISFPLLSVGSHACRRPVEPLGRGVQDILCQHVQRAGPAGALVRCPRCAAHLGYELVSSQALSRPGGALVRCPRCAAHLGYEIVSSQALSRPGGALVRCPRCAPHLGFELVSSQALSRPGGALVRGPRCAPYLGFELVSVKPSLGLQVPWHAVFGVFLT